MTKNGELFEYQICMNSGHTIKNKEIVKPVVIMKSGVFNGHLKTPAELEQSTRWWEGVAIVIKNESSIDGHPQTMIVTNKTLRIGQILDVKWDIDNEKLVANAHIDTELCPEWLLKDIESGKVKGVSGTYFVDLIPKTGELDGKKYTFVEQHYVPNNVTIVNNPACTPKDGCGLDMNELKLDCSKLQEESEFELDENCKPKLDSDGKKILKTVKVDCKDIKKNEGEKMDEKLLEDMQTKIKDMEIQINSLKDELKIKDGKLEQYEKAQKELDFLAQFPEMNREAAKVELLPMFLEDPMKLVMTNSKRLGELLTGEKAAAVEQSKGVEHVDLEIQINSEGAEIDAMLPKIERIQDMVKGKF